MNGPFEVTLKVHLTNGEQDATVDYVLPPGQAALPSIVNQVLDAAVKEAGPGWVLLKRPEFEIVKEVPSSGKEGWDE